MSSPCGFSRSGLILDVELTNVKVSVIIISFFFFPSIAVSSDSKELYAGYSSQQIVGWVKPKSSSAQEDTEFEHLPGTTMEAYYTP